MASEQGKLTPSQGEINLGGVEVVSIPIQGLPENPQGIFRKGASTRVGRRNRGEAAELDDREALDTGEFAIEVRLVTEAEENRDAGARILTQENEDLVEDAVVPGGESSDRAALIGIGTRLLPPLHDRRGIIAVARVDPDKPLVPVPVLRVREIASQRLGDDSGDSLGLLFLAGQRGCPIRARISERRKVAAEPGFIEILPVDAIHRHPSPRGPWQDHVLYLPGRILIEPPGVGEGGCFDAQDSRLEAVQSRTNVTGRVGRIEKKTSGGMYRPQHEDRPANSIRSSCLLPGQDGRSSAECRHSEAGDGTVPATGPTKTM